jgi:hypothetical protein
MSGAGRRGAHRLAAVLLFASLGSLSVAREAAAQLSPGPLAEPHAALEGAANCLRCHSSEKGVDPQRCLDCHRLIAARIEAGRGLHARPGYADCKSCHIDHHGRDFELVWWGEEGMEAFDHALSGYRLEGAHRDLGCRDCHREGSNPAAAALRRVGKDPGRSFLGLDTACLSCHHDEHRGQFEAGRCVACHVQDTWLTARGLDHDRTPFPLTGRHRQVDCAGCHATVAQPLGGDPDFVRFVGVAFHECSACHRDPHEGRFGAACGGCHVTSGWQRLDGARFDHDLTRYPLRGRHRSVPCESCHRAGAPRRGIAFASCTDCHADEHAGQLAGRDDGGRCESCHTVEGFRPADFGVADHAASFPLEGAHRSVPCDSCHSRVAATELLGAGLADPAALGGGGELVRLRFASTACAACHADPHAGSARVDGDALACESCHRPTLWSETAFDHSATGFELAGAHARLGCARCHRPDGEVGGEALAFAGLGLSCVDCHEDRHRGQLAGARELTGCGRCHGPETWIPASGFDHERDAAFALEGAHARVPCAGCHRTESDAAGEFVRFRPLARRCADCHGGAS